MLRGMTYEEANSSAENWCADLGMTEYLDVPAEQLSKGNQQKIQLISAFVNNPDILFLDEPFAGLDPVNIQVIKKAISKLVKNGTYIILSTHQMPVVEEYCRDILLINNGINILSGNLLDIKKSYGNNNVLIKSKQDIRKFLPNNSHIINQAVNTIEFLFDGNPNILLKELIKNNIEIEKFEIKEPSLQEIFIRKVGETK